MNIRIEKFAAVAMAFAAGCCGLQDGSQPVASVVSPDGKNEIRLWTNPLAYEASRDGVVVVSKTAIGMTIDGRELKPIAAASLLNKRHSGAAAMPVYKHSKLDLAGNETLVNFGKWSVRLAARDDGVAYRFETGISGRIMVNGERAALTIPEVTARCSLNYGNSFGCEETIPLSTTADAIATEATGSHQYVYLPMLYSVRGKWVAVTESDVCDYPIWNLKRGQAENVAAFNGHFAGWPLDEVHAAESPGKWSKSIELESGGRWVQVRQYADYLVETVGTRTFPWRVFMLADTPSKFCEADIVAALARGPQPERDFAWVKPGKVAWDWWNAWDNQGEAKGCNTATYKRFIDFAAKHGVEYVILDEGWSEKLNIWKFHPNVDVPEIIRYGNSKGVGIILWMAWAQIYGDEARVAEHFAKLGAKGFKVDFMDRGDAKCERFLWTFAEECAKNRMLVDYHGAHRPTGMSRAYPNVLNYEGVHGLECAKWFHNEYDFMDNDVKQFFLRMTAGPMDYTPGAMDNYPIGKYAIQRNNPGSVGTRAHQLAMMIAYEAPLQMLCDSPTKYERNLECFEFMAKVPVVWQRTVGLGGNPDTFAAVARQAADGTWYAAAINSGTARAFELDTSFLRDGVWQAEIFRDASDSDREPQHYLREAGKVVKSGDRLALPLAPGGGFAIRFRRQTL